MKIIRLITGDFKENTYIVVDEKSKRGALIDPGDDSDAILSAMSPYEIVSILLTHTHFDHILGLTKVYEKNRVQVVVSEFEQNVITEGKMNPPDLIHFSKALPKIHTVLKVRGEEIFSIDNLNIRVIATPGHTSGSLSFLINDALFSGDTLFAKSIGRTDLPTGNFDEIMNSIKRLFELPGDTKVYPGHGDSTTIAKRVQDFQNGSLY
ncbi:MBL fold metallo-hydrolase [Candidatus Peregrinibacteria bacterium]|nr:MBL fold metallo-hydrolase [Candidatus Peregrinibacteria bacterium]